MCICVRMNKHSEYTVSPCTFEHRFSMSFLDQGISLLMSSPGPIHLLFYLKEVGKITDCERNWQ